MHVLVSFLGRTPHSENGYRQTIYRLPDGTTEEAAFLGYALQRWLRPQRLVILGTAGSMWDHLFERDVAFGGHDYERIALMDAVKSGAVEQAQLDGLAPQLAALLGCETVLRLIPEALAEHEQVALLQALAQTIESAERLSIDVTHGYRHLPMIALTAALYLRAVRPDLAIEGLWYGAYQPETNTADVCNLSGLLNITDWIEALQRHDWLGDYGAVAKLIKNDHKTVAEDLRQAAFCESIHQGQQARGLLRKVRSRLHKQLLSGPGALFQPLLEERMKWIDSDQPYQRQRAHAAGALDRDDLLRAALYGFEAFITKLTQQQEGIDQADNEAARQRAAESYWRHRPPNTFQAYDRLRDIRNALAHGDRRPDRPDVRQAMESPEKLRHLIGDCLQRLLPSEQPQ